MSNGIQTVNKVRAFFQEFSFLYSLVNERYITSVEVSRISEEVLAFFVDPKWLMHNCYRDIFLVSNTGSLLTKVGLKRTLFGIIKWTERETVAAAIERMGSKAQAIGYIVTLDKMTDSPGLVVYKVPKGWKLLDWIEHCITLHKNVISQETSAIDAEGDRIKS